MYVMIDPRKPQLDAHSSPMLQRNPDIAAALAYFFLALFVGYILRRAIDRLRS